jgi:hypothetical protein
MWQTTRYLLSLGSDRETRINVEDPVSICCRWNKLPRPMHQPCSTLANRVERYVGFFTSVFKFLTYFFPPFSISLFFLVIISALSPFLPASFLRFWLFLPSSQTLIILLPLTPPPPLLFSLLYLIASSPRLLSTLLFATSPLSLSILAFYFLLSSLCLPLSLLHLLYFPSP